MNRYLLEQVKNIFEVSDEEAKRIIQDCHEDYLVESFGAIMHFTRKKDQKKLYINPISWG